MFMLTTLQKIYEKYAFYSRTFLNIFCSRRNKCDFKMPQNHRKVPFSTKAKKAQLQERRQRKKDDDGDGGGGRAASDFSANETLAIRECNRGRYALKFYDDSKEMRDERRRQAEQTIVRLNGTDTFELNANDYYPREMRIPERPRWQADWSREQLLQNEESYFADYVNDLVRCYGRENLAYFELNLETWRQFWRVCEKSDILLMICDCRFGLLQFPPRVYHEARKTKSIILVLSKIDLVPAETVVAWKRYFEETYRDLKVTFFVTYPIRKGDGGASGGIAAEGLDELYEICKDLVGDSVDLHEWRAKIDDDNGQLCNDRKSVQIEKPACDTDCPDSGPEPAKRFGNGTLTIGCIGFPNVGKSSLINALIGKKVVSISRTPGHTKHFQTIYLTSNVILCDCPGLVFPSLMPRTLQILIGSYPIAHVREPYTTVRFLAERYNLPEILKLPHPERGETDWSALDICDAWATKRGFFTAKSSSRPDTYRGANHLLRLVLDGKQFAVCFRPPTGTQPPSESNQLLARIRDIQTNVSQLVFRRNKR